MDATKSFIKIYNISPQDAKDFEFDYTVDDSSILSELVPKQDNWGDLSWGIEFEEYGYASNSNTMHLTLCTEQQSPTEWLRNASLASHYFENKLVTMTTIRGDETSVLGVAVMDGEILQNKEIFRTDLEEVKKYYNDEESDYELDELDNQILDSITKFVAICEQFYLGKGEEDDY